MYSEAVRLASGLAAAGAAKAASSASACQAVSGGANLRVMFPAMQCCQCLSSCKVHLGGLPQLPLHTILVGFAFGMAAYPT